MSLVELNRFFLCHFVIPNAGAKKKRSSFMGVKKEVPWSLMNSLLFRYMTGKGRNRDCFHLLSQEWGWGWGVGDNRRRKEKKQDTESCEQDVAAAVRDAHLGPSSQRWLSVSLLSVVPFSSGKKESASPLTFMLLSFSLLTRYVS